MASTAQKYNTLNGTNVSNTPDTLLFPSDLLTEGQNGACMTLFINTVKNGTTKLNITGSNPSNVTPTVTSAYGQIPILNVESRSLSGSKKIESFSNTYIRSNQTITLPMPRTLDLSSKTSWSKVDFNSTAGVLDQVSDYSKSIAGGAGLAKRLAMNTVGSVAEKQGIKGSKDLVEFGEGSIANNYAETLFKGVSNRSFSWQFTLTPRNMEEARTIDNMLRMLRFHHLPEFDANVGNGNAYLLYPSSFDIVFWLDGSPNPWIPRISTCALTSIDCNYHSSGYIRMKDGSPQSYTLNLQFDELMALNKSLASTLDSSGTSF
jgi:hypothetical protein